MTTKFPKSNIEISGQIEIRTGNGIVWEIDIKGLKQSKSGVYCLRNKLNGRIYIGMARNLQIRRDRHFRDLVNGTHCNEKLQDEFDEYFLQNGHGQTDPSIFLEFEIIIYCRSSELTFYENLLIKHLNPYYNLHKAKKLEYTDNE